MNEGKHLIIDFYKIGKFPTTTEIYNILATLPDMIDMKKLTLPYVVKGADHLPGWTGNVIIETSHITIHTFEDGDYIAFDLFSCKTFDEQVVIKFLEEQFQTDISFAKMKCFER